MVLVLAAVAAAPGAAGTQDGPEPAMRAAPDRAPRAVEDPPASTTILSNERTLSRWAYVERRVTARKRPGDGAPRVKRLKLTTEDGTPELVLALKWKHLDDGTPWVRVRLPMRPNGKKGWVPREALSKFRVVRTRLVIDRNDFKFSLYRRGHRVIRGPIGVGKKRNPTPAGHFYVRERLVPVNSDSVYGVFAFGTSAFSGTLTDWPGGGIIGVHGTNQPGLIPGRISHGCVRIRNHQIRKLKRMMPLGTPILIR
jgi:hypothetical protein